MLVCMTIFTRSPGAMMSVVGAAESAPARPTAASESSRSLRAPLRPRSTRLASPYDQKQTAKIGATPASMGAVPR